MVLWHAGERMRVRKACRLTPSDAFYLLPSPKPPPRSSRFWTGGPCRHEEKIQEVVHYSRFAEQEQGQKWLCLSFFVGVRCHLQKSFAPYFAFCLLSLFGSFLLNWPERIINITLFQNLVVIKIDVHGSTGPEIPVH